MNVVDFRQAKKPEKVTSATAGFFLLGLFLVAAVALLIVSLFAAGFLAHEAVRLLLHGWRSA